MIQCMIQWTNSNQGFASVMLSVVTILLAIIAIWVSISTSKMQNKIALFEKRHEIFYILWKWCDISKITFDDLSNPQIDVFFELLSNDYQCPNEVYYTGNIIGSAKYLYPFECVKAEEFRTAFVDMAYKRTEENLQKLKTSFEELKKSNLLDEMRKCLKV